MSERSSDGRRVAILRLLLQRARTDLGDVRRHRFGHARRRRVDRFDGALRSTRRAMRRFPGRELEQHRTEQIDVGALRYRLGDEADHLGRGIGERSARLLHDLCAREMTCGLAARRDREAPIEQVDLTEGADHDVARLEIAMEDVLRMRELDDLADANEHANVLLEQVTRALFLRPVFLVEQRLPRLPADAPHDDDRVVVLALRDVVDRNDAGVLEIAGHPSFEQHPLRVFRRAVRRRRLHRDGATERTLDRGSHDAHSAFGDHLADVDGGSRARPDGRRAHRRGHPRRPLDLRHVRRDVGPGFRDVAPHP